MSKEQFEDYHDSHIPPNYHAEAAQQAADRMEESFAAHNKVASKKYFDDINELQDKWDRESMQKSNLPPYNQLGNHNE